LYTLSPSDEKSLDGSEEFPDVYQKVIMPIKVIRTTAESSSNDETTSETTTDFKSNVTTMIYISFPEIISASPRDEYVPRMEKAVNDALRKGIPQSYLSKYIIPGLIKPE
jgi:gamma-glutamylcyclotransferase